ncbi:SusC/RagA family TonB-linked outer membrane protein [Siphonobacter sp. BAB-5385]|uniref:TonB-dependent receptor n=1 Tax=Siphonobacter sp. BAB-5385 TaxID=1864822 RepID=UPI000B9E1B52|nr:TonB-dependent receptor [Siphonobacter sp. BAB-5385]OZI09358.1 SusC/RagA family TonB-linked outer membrane protein [Siphonobacter sp. BAB-5385]
MKKTKRVLLTLMKITVIQLVLATSLFTMSFAYDGKAQDLLNKKVTLSIQGQSIKEALKAVERLANVKFVYSSQLIQADRKVTISVTNESLNRVLAQLLQPYRLTYEVSGGNIILSRNITTLPTRMGGSSSLMSIPAVVITGRVTDAAGAGIPGTTVRLKGGSAGTSTDADGKFSLNVPDGSGTLIFSSIGYATKEVEIANQTSLNVTLEADTKQLTEVVVVGYGTQKKQDLTGAVSVINVSQLTEQPSPQITSQLQGRASGVTVLGSGQPGEAPQIRIRGINTFGNNSPLYVVDGVPTQNINDINPNDIASMQILKDAGSASIYGSRAANGVVILTTKRGSGKIKVSYDAYYGVQTPKSGNVWNILSPQDMANLKFRALRNTSDKAIDDPQYGTGPDPRLPTYIEKPDDMTDDNVDESKYYVNPNYTDKADYDRFARFVRANKAGTDWFHEIFKPASIQSHNVAVSGGGTQGNYLFSLNYFNQQGTLLNTYLKRYTIRSNSQFNISDHVRVGENLAFAVSDNRRVNSSTEGSAIGMAFRMQPIIPVYDIRGNYAGSFGDGLGNAKNPVAIQERARNNKGLNNRLFGNMYIEADFLKDFVARSSFGGEIFSGAFNSFAYPEYENAENLTINSYTENTFSGFNWTWTNTLTWSHNFNNTHDLKVLVGTEAYRNRGRNVGGTTTGYFSFDPNFTNLSTGSGTPTNYSSRYADALFSLIGRIDYNLLGKYLVSATVRRDGSSRFLNTQYGVFPAFSAGWRISQEEFMKNVSWITELKLRGGYGIMGNQLNVDPANAYTAYGGIRGQSYYDITGSNKIQEGFQRTRIGNPDAKWERNINSNIGIDATLFKGKLDIALDYYRKDIRDLLYNPELAATVGLGSAPFVNIANMKNSGIDLAITWNGNITSDLKFNVTGTLTTYDNKIQKVSNGSSYFDQEGRRFNGSSIVRNAVGHSIGQFFGYKIDGFWDSQDEINQANQQARERTGNASAIYQTDVAVGRFRYADVNGDGQVTDADRTFLGNPNPKFSYGINLGLNYKNFDFGIFLYGVKGNDIWNNVRWWTDFYTNFAGAKSYTAYYDSWTPDHMNAKAPIQEDKGSFSTNQVPNSYYIEKGSYLRAKNAQIGYTFPANMLKSVGVSRLRVYVQTANLFTITKYSGLDPEIGTTVNTNNSSGGSNNQSFSTTTSFGIDEGVYPNQRQFLLGLNLSF